MLRNKEVSFWKLRWITNYTYSIFAFLWKFVVTKDACCIYMYSKIIAPVFQSLSNLFQWSGLLWVGIMFLQFMAKLNFVFFFLQGIFAFVSPNKVCLHVVCFFQCNVHRSLMSYMQSLLSSLIQFATTMHW